MSSPTSIPGRPTSIPAPTAPSPAGRRTRSREVKDGAAGIRLRRLRLGLRRRPILTFLRPGRGWRPARRRARRTPARHCPGSQAGRGSVLPGPGRAVRGRPATRSSGTDTRRDRPRIRGRQAGTPVPIAGRLFRAVGAPLPVTAFRAMAGLPLPATAFRVVAAGLPLPVTPIRVVAAGLPLPVTPIRAVGPPLPVTAFRAVAGLPLPATAIPPGGPLLPTATPTVVAGLPARPAGIPTVAAGPFPARVIPRPAGGLPRRVTGTPGDATVTPRAPIATRARRTGSRRHRL